MVNTLSLPSLVIPIASTSSNESIEIFPEELKELNVTTILKVLKDESNSNSSATSADQIATMYADTAVLYMQLQNARDSLTVLQAAGSGGDSGSGGSSNDGVATNVRILASTGIAYLTRQQQQQQQGGSGGGNSNADGGADSTDLVYRNSADQKFTKAAGLDTFFPMTWMGRGMLNLYDERPEQAHFFFQTTLKECGNVLPAVLGLAAVQFGQGKYKMAQSKYGEAIRLYPVQSGAPARVGFGYCCYKLGQIDRARSCFSRALDIDNENVDAMVGAAVLDINTENAVKRMSMANLFDHSNAMVQNHLANHYFWKWTSAGTASINNTSNSNDDIDKTATVSIHQNVMTCTQPLGFEVGDPIRIGDTFETNIVEDLDDGMKFKLHSKYRSSDGKNSTTQMKLWKKDYERVFVLAKGAYSSTNVQAIQAESLFILARVYHVRGELENAHKCYSRAVKQAPNLTPARFGLAQTFVVQENFDDAIKHLKLIIASNSSATDAYALLGLIYASSSTKKTSDATISNSSNSNATYNDGLVHLRKAIDLDPTNPDLVLLETLALQQHRGNYAKALKGYRHAVTLFEISTSVTAAVPYEVYTNIGVLCHEMKQLDDSYVAYNKALQCFSSGSNANENNATILEKNTGIDGIFVRQSANHMFNIYVDTSCSGTFVDTSNNNSTNENSETVCSSTKFKLQPAQSQTSAFNITVGEHVRIGPRFTTEVIGVSTENDGEITILELKDAYDMAAEKQKDEENQENKPPGSDDADDTAVKTLTVFVKRENDLLNNDDVTTIAFNIARLHEASGQTLAAIELHKAIVKRNPAYVNGYLRLACIAVDCGSLTECAEWLKIAAGAAPNNSEVLVLIGNLHLSLCDWKPAQRVFDNLMFQKVASVEAYSGLSMGNIYFANLHVSESNYAKHLDYAAGYYKRILIKDPLNAHAANGIGTVLAELGDIFKAKDAFNRVREVSGDGIADALLNLGHIYLAQKKHPEALQLYKSFMKKAEDISTPITSKSRADDIVDVLLYIAFAYFDWARHTELFNDANAAPADSRYKDAMQHLDRAIQYNSKKHLVLKYNLCMIKLQAANCVLQKLTRNIPRTVEEVEEALKGLEESLKVVEMIIEEKKQGKVPMPTSTLDDFVKHCNANITSAQSHLVDEKKRAEEEKAEQEIRRLTADTSKREAELREALKREEAAKAQEERDMRADAKMRKVEELQSGWQHERNEIELKKAKKRTADPNRAGGMQMQTSLEEEIPSHQGGLFDDSDDDSDDDNAGTTVPTPSGASAKESGNKPTSSDLFGDSDSDDDDDDGDDKPMKPAALTEKSAPAAAATSTTSGLFDSSDDDSDAPATSRPTKAESDTQKQEEKETEDEESDEELVPTAPAKRSKEIDEGEQPDIKKQKV